MPTPLGPTLTHFFTRIAPVRPDQGLIVAFSGGPDSAALLVALLRLAHTPGPLEGLRLIAAHLDHATDPGSAGRAGHVVRLASRLGVPLVTARRPVAERARPGESPEAVGRRVRYGFLAEVRREAGARWIATGHHRDDQAETVLLRLLLGSGPEGLAGIRPVRGRVVRPLLGVARSELAATLQIGLGLDLGPELGPGPSAPADTLEPVVDPTNRDRSIPRNRIRHELLPALAAQERGTHDVAPGGSHREEDALAERLAAVARAAAGARDRLERTFENLLHPTSCGLSASAGSPARATRSPSGPSDPSGLSGPSDPSDPEGTAMPERGVAIPLAALDGLPPALVPHALAFLHRRGGAPYPAGAAAREELCRQLRLRRPSASAAPRAVGCDAGGGWRWRVVGERLELHPAPPSAATAEPVPPGRPTARSASPPAANGSFSYTLSAPGTVRIPELGVTVRLRRAPVAPWMFRGETERAGLALPFESAFGPAADEEDDERPAGRLVVRTRRPGDRLRPLGAPGVRKLKDVLIDRRIPRERRDRLPLLCLGERIAWVPGVTVDEAFRIPPGAETAWIAEIGP